MNTRKKFLTGAAVTMAAAGVSRHALAGLPEPVIQNSPNTQIYCSKMINIYNIYL